MQELNAFITPTMSLKDITDLLETRPPRFGYQNLYPIKAFQEAYPHIDFDDLKPEIVDDKAQLAIV